MSTSVKNNWLEHFRTHRWESNSSIIVDATDITILVLNQGNNNYFQWYLWQKRVAEAPIKEEAEHDANGRVRANEVPRGDLVVPGTATLSDRSNGLAHLFQNKTSLKIYNDCA